MFNNMKSEYFNWMVIGGLFLLLLEVSLFSEGLIFSLLASGAMIYFGRSLMPKRKGKLLFWGGLFFFLSSVFNMVTFRLFLFAVLLFIIYQLVQSKKKPEKIIPTFKEPERVLPKEVVISHASSLKNRLMGNVDTPSHVYDWNDVNILTGIGDSIIDFSLTVLPKGESVIFIRKGMGNVRVFVPYDTEVMINHSAIAGSARVFGHEEVSGWNQNVSFQTTGYEEALQKVKIVTSIVSGTLEVIRI